MTTTQALSILTLAIQNVRPCYIRIDAIPDCDIKRIQVERSFAYELYHQWSILLEAWRSLHPTGNNLRLNGEITKDLDLNSRSYPDMILHGGQESLENQILVCEIKELTVLILIQRKYLRILKNSHSFCILRSTAETI